MRGRQAAGEFKLPPCLSRRNATGEWSPGQQINYGTGKSVNEETVAGLSAACAGQAAGAAMSKFSSI